MGKPKLIAQWASLDLCCKISGGHIADSALREASQTASSTKTRCNSIRTKKLDQDQNLTKILPNMSGSKKRKAVDYVTEFVTFSEGTKKSRDESARDEYVEMLNTEIDNSDLSLGLEYPDDDADEGVLLRTILRNQFKLGSAVAKLMVASQVSQNIIRNAVQDEFKRVSSEDEWDVLNERLETDTAFRLVVKRLLCACISTEFGLNTSIRKAITACLDTEFILISSWSGVNGVVKVKDTQFSTLLSETVLEVFEGVALQRVYEVISAYISNKRKTERRTKNKGRSSDANISGSGNVKKEADPGSDQ